jgi:hypothetical protein
LTLTTSTTLVENCLAILSVDVTTGLAVCLHELVHQNLFMALLCPLLES